MHESTHELPYPPQSKCSRLAMGALRHPRALEKEINAPQFDRIRASSCFSG